MLPAGIILTGGASQLAGTAELGREVLQMPVRVSGPTGIGGLVDTIQHPSYSTSVGLLRWGAHGIGEGEPLRYESAPGGGGFGRLRDAIRSDLPVGDAAAMRSIELEVRTGRDRGFTDLTPACARFAADAVGRRRRAAVGVRAPRNRGLVIMELGAGSEDDAVQALDRLLPRDDRWRHRHGSPGHGADHVLPLLVSPSLTVPVVAGRPTLGTWQSITLLDPNEDNATRRVRLSFLAG